MGLFGFDSKRKPLLQPHTSTPGSKLEKLPDVEVCELIMDHEEFSSTFGLGASEFADLPDLADDDPWTRRLRLD